METKPLIYLAHPVAPVDGETVDGNLADAMGWLVNLIEHKPEWTVIAPWIAELKAFGVDADRDPAKRSAALGRCAAVAARCDGIVLCGPRVSSGMKKEAWLLWFSQRPVYQAQRRGPSVDISDMRGWAHEFIHGVPRFLCDVASQP